MSEQQLDTRTDFARQLGEHMAEQKVAVKSGKGVKRPEGVPRTSPEKVALAEGQMRREKNVRIRNEKIFLSTKAHKGI